MKLKGKHSRTIWVAEDGQTIFVLDQTKLPHRIEEVRLGTVAEVADAISDMIVRGAPLIGVTGAYGIALAMTSDPSNSNLSASYDRLVETRPTAVNLKWALDRMVAKLEPLSPDARAEAAYSEASAITEEDVGLSSSIGDHGVALIEAAWDKNGRTRPVNVLTHCNAGWLATVDWGTATAPIYKAFHQGIPVHVYVDETRPRNQGASLTAFELNEEGVPHTVIVDNAGGHLMQHGMVDLCIVGSDRTTASGDVANKIGTYLKALAAYDNNVPFYAALPSSTIDWTMNDGIREIPIETRSAREVTHLSGKTASGMIETIQITPDGSPAINYGFDVTPARLVTGIITERGIASASRDGLRAQFSISNV